MRVRFRFSKLGKVRWTSHRDVARMWERALRRAQLSVTYTGGFSPRPKVSFGLALPTGAESVCEYLDVEFEHDPDELDVITLPARLSPALPAGVDVQAAVVIDDRAESLQQAVSSCRWEIAIETEQSTRGVSTNPSGQLSGLVATVLDAGSVVITRERKGQTVSDDVRPAILSCSVIAESLIECELATQPRGLRPSELLRALSPELEESSVRRTHQWIVRDGAQWEPIPLDATSAPHAGARAS
jgi:radical SAM-linked protein